MTIILNDILNFDSKELNNMKIRFIKPYKDEDPLDLFKNNKTKLLEWQFWNYEGKRSFKAGQIAVGFVKIEDNKWLLFDVSKITADLNTFNGMGYEYEPIERFKKYLGRVVIEYKNKAQQMVRIANTVIDDCKVLQILEDTFDNDIFPGYENVNISWQELQRVINKESWKTALKNQKGVYLITDKSNGKMYVGAAYGKDMIHGRWSEYLKNGHGTNSELKALDFDHIKNNFYYSILNIYKSTIHDDIIIDRETWWKITLQTRKFDNYNKN